MAKAGEIVRDALAVLGVLDMGEAVEAAEMEDGIRRLNQMMRRWEANGLSLGWNDVSGVEDALHTPPEADEAIVTNLAVKLRSRYGVVLEGDVIQMANTGYAVLLRDRHNAKPMQWREDLPLAPGHYDIRTDSWR